MPLTAPPEPMLAELQRELPAGDYLYEPKWDGFRCIAAVRAGQVELFSRHQRPLARYFPEVVAALAPLGEVVLDGELVIARRDGFDFAALMDRLHPSRSRVELLSAKNPATLIAFDLLGAGDEALTETPFAERRRRLEALIGPPRPALQATPATPDRAVAQRWLDDFQGRGIDGVVAKARDLTYQPGRRAMVKVKRLHTVECVVAGLRLQADRPVLGSLLLGMYEDGRLRHVGVSSTFALHQRRTLLDELRPLVAPLEGHPWQHGFGIDRSPMGRLKGAAGRWDPQEMSFDWMPLRIERVCEVAYDQVDAGRFRHPARFLRWRPDREPASCAFEQLQFTAAPLSQVLPTP